MRVLHDVNLDLDSQDIELVAMALERSKRTRARAIVWRELEAHRRGRVQREIVDSDGNGEMPTTSYSDADDSCYAGANVNMKCVAGEGLVLPTKSILSPTRRGNGDSASPWKAVTFDRDPPSGFPERRPSFRRNRTMNCYVKSRGDDQSQWLALALVFATLLFVALTSQALEALHAMFVLASG
jgi:hypothetical protein|uniref:Uncharacterized protein n=1 Tax=Ostreococcus mediterraneus TaxID=1486918 RepID=A0A6U0BXT3_9CHLO|mmetsp:Transcript_8838/g.32846  ORF Transcript_8838/g.32846 Transcript_8838/m.32846 type:complete len:183 (+) Transcript_8838:86-634(+)